MLHVPAYDKAITRLFLIKTDQENIIISHICHFSIGNEISYLTILYSFWKRSWGDESKTFLSSPKCPKSSSGAHPAFYLVCTAILPLRWRRWSVMLTTHLHPVLTLRMSGAIHPLPPTQLCGMHRQNCTFTFCNLYMYYLLINPVRILLLLQHSISLCWQLLSYIWHIWTVHPDIFA